MVTPKLENYKKILDDIVLRLTIYWIRRGWMPRWLIIDTKSRRLRERNRRAVEDLLTELEK